jgi:hypothetical protein
MALPTCLSEGCEGQLFTERTLASGELKRISTLTYPYTSIKSWLQHMLSRDRYPELMQAWCKDSDHGRVQPISSREWYDRIDLEQPLGDIFDGWGWRSRIAGLERTHNAETGEVSDQSLCPKLGQGTQRGWRLRPYTW